MMLALVGLKANAAMYIIGDAPFGGWNPPVGVEMTLSNDGVTYTYNATLTSADVWFIFAEAAGNWNDVNANRYDSGMSTDMTVYADVEFTPVKGNTNKSFKFTGTVGETYTITFNPTTMKAKVSGYVAPITEYTYTVAGNNAAIFGEEWNTTLTANDMTLDETDGLYKLQKDSVEISAGYTLYYKVVQNHSWGTNWGKTPNGDNQDYTFNESGLYNLTFIFDLENEAVSLNAVPIQQGPAVNPLTGELYVLGQVNGNNWNPSTGIAMTTTDGNVFTLTDAVITEGDGGYGFFSFTSKLGVDANDWSFLSYRRGALEDGTIVTPDSAAVLAGWGTTGAFKVLPGTYDITVNLSAGTVLLTAKETPQPEVDKVYIMGNIDNHEFVPNQGVEMTYDETNKVYTAEINVHNAPENNLGYFGFTKMLAETEDGWATIAPYRFGPESVGDFEMTEALLGTNCVLAEEGYESIAIPAGTWTVTVDLVNNTFKVDGTWPTDTVIPEPELDNVYIMGNMEGYTWDAVSGVQMTYDETNKVYTAEINVVNADGHNVGYIGFTKMLADTTAEDAWAAIAPYRFGPVCDPEAENWVMLEELLGIECALATDGSYKSIAIPEGTWTVTVDLENNKFMIDGTWPVDTVVPETPDVYIIGDVNNIGWSATNGVQMTYNEETQVYTAAITTQNQGDLGVAYFGFTKMLADTTAEDAWAAIAPYRFGPVSEGAFTMTENLLGVECNLATDGSYNSIAIPEGTWTVTVDLVNNKFMIDGTWPVDTVVPEPYTGDLYILGEVNGNGWAPNTGVQMTYDAETALFTAQVTAEAQNFDEELQANYSYFSFTKLLAETADDWAAIASSRMGAVADGNFLVTDEYLGQELSLTNGEVAFKVPSGYTYDITVSVDEMYVIINKVEWELGDVNHDHFVDVADVTALIAYILGNDPERFFTTEANVDGDEQNSYDVGDVTALIAKILAN